MALHRIEEAILYVALLSSRNVLCNCALCYPQACSLAERALERKNWTAFATSSTHAIRFPRAAADFPLEPFIHNPKPEVPLLRFSHSQVVKGLEAARIQALTG